MTTEPLAGHSSGRLVSRPQARNEVRAYLSDVRPNQRSGMTGVFGCQGKTPTAGRGAIRSVVGHLAVGHHQ